MNQTLVNQKSTGKDTWSVCRISRPGVIKGMQQTATIQRQYDDVIAQHYDADPQGVTAASLSRAIDQLDDEKLLMFRPALPALNVLDLGMGTGMFLDQLIAKSYRTIDPFGVDLSANMAEIAQQKIPHLHSCVDDAANFDDHFPGQSFDLICTHFITGFVAMEQLAPLIMKRLAPGGYWSFVGSSKVAYPALRQRATNPLIRMMFGGAKLSLDDMLCPTHEGDLRQKFENSGFDIVDTKTFEPSLLFRNMAEFMEYAYTGGWLTPFIEDLGLQNAGKTTRRLLNTFVFPVRDHHSVLIGLARKSLVPKS